MAFTGLPSVGPNGEGRSQLVAELQQRLGRVISGDWRTLLEEYIFRVENPPDEAPAGTHSDPEEALADEIRRRIPRVEKLVRLGELRRAADTLVSDSSAVRPSPSVLAELRDKHPSRERPIDPADLHPPVPPPHLKLTPEALRQALATSPKGSAGGCSGWTSDHLRAAALDDQQLFAELLAVCQLIAEGLLPRDVARLIGAGRLVALSKPGSATAVRPISVGDILRRLTGRAVCIQMREIFQGILAPLQLGVGVSCGAETATRAVQAWLELHPDHTLLFVDIKNAFNSVSRAKIFRELNAHPQLRCLIPMVRQFYADTGDLWYDMGPGQAAASVDSAEGTQQGDPLAGFLFALAIHSALARAADALGHLQRPQAGLAVGFFDDLTLAGPATLLAEVFQALKVELLDEASCDISLPKTVALNLTSDISGIFPDEIRVVDAATAPEERGIIHLGVPQGTPEYVRAKVTGVFISHATLPQRLAKYAVDTKQCALLLLRKCAHPKAVFWLRSLPPDLCSHAASEIDRELLDTLGAILGADFRAADAAHAAAQAALPGARGGLGLTQLHQLAAYAHVASVYATQAMLALLCPAAAQAYADALPREQVGDSAGELDPNAIDLMDADLPLPLQSRFRQAVLSLLPAARAELPALLLGGALPRGRPARASWRPYRAAAAAATSRCFLVWVQVPYR